MADQKSFNLDEAGDYVSFTLNKKKYRIRYMTLKEVEAFSKIERNNKAFFEFLAPLVLKDETDAPEFKDMYDTMTLPQINRFVDMVTSQMSA